MKVKDFYPLSEDDLLELGILIETEGIMWAMRCMNIKLGYVLPLDLRVGLINKIKEFTGATPLKQKK